MPILWLIIAIILVEQAAPGFLGQVGSLAASGLLSPVFVAAFCGSSLAGAIWYSLGQSHAARQVRDAGIKKAEDDYNKYKGWL